MTIVLFLKINGESPKRIMCVGDSITLGTDNTLGYQPKLDGFRYRLWYLLRRADVACKFVGPFSDGNTYANSAWDDEHAGVGGTTLLTIDTAVAAWIAAHTPDLIVLLGGVNDIQGGASAATTLTRLEAVVDTINATPTSPDIIVSTTTAHSSYLAACATYNASIEAAVVAKGAAFVDSASDVSAANRLLSDSVHPSGLGYEVMAQRMAVAIAALP